MILINSANFQFADIDLSKEIFFVGDNASGKTTTTRALHFLYNGDGQKLGIPRSKDSFAKHYLPLDDSYIIYVFESFFIFTYRRNDIIRRWFSKQEFNENEIIKNGKLVDFREIEKYIKSASLKRKPETIEEYTSILYGANKKYLDFSIAKIDNYKIFLDIFNMIFNIDKAIVTAKDIKEAIQKSLDRKDEMLNIDYDDFIRKLNGFSRSYHFFKTFDGSRGSLKQALALKDELLTLEKEELIKRREIAYRYPLEIAEFNTQEESIAKISEEINNYKKRMSKIELLYVGFEKRLSKKIKALEKEIMQLESLREEFDSLDIDENTTLANQHDGIDKELNDKRYSLNKLKEKQTTAQKEIENQIEQINYKIKIIIPNEMQQNIFTLSEIEKSNHENEVLEIKKEYESLKDEARARIRVIYDEIKIVRDSNSAINLEILKAQELLKEGYKAKLLIAQTQKAINEEKVTSVEQKIKRAENLKLEQELKIREHEKRYLKLRSENAKILASKRVLLNNKISNARAILNPIANSFNAFLSTEIDGWEKNIYPILDKNLLKMSCNELQPEIIDSKTPLGFRINVEHLDSIPTKDEALEIIKVTREDKIEYLRNSKEVYRAALLKLDEEKNDLLAELESNTQEIENLIEELSEYNINIIKTQKKLEQLSQEQIVKLEEIDDKYRQKRESNSRKITKLDDENSVKNEELHRLDKSRSAEIKKGLEKRDFNIDVIKKQELKVSQDRIEEAKDKIKVLHKNIKSINEDDMILELFNEVKLLGEQFKASLKAIEYLKKYENSKELIIQLPFKEIIVNRYNKLYLSRKEFVKKLSTHIKKKMDALSDEKSTLQERHSNYAKGIDRAKLLKFDMPEDILETTDLLLNLIHSYEEILRVYGNQKSKLRTSIDTLRKLESYSFIELSFNMHKFDETTNISELDNILEGLSELESFERNKYQSEKKRNHNNFKAFLSGTIPGKLRSLNDLENEFNKAKESINRNLSHADFGVIKDIKLVTDSSKNRNDSIKSLLDSLSKKVQDTIGLYSNDSLFYHDIPKSVGNIADIESILQDIKKKASSNSINLLDTIDLSMSYIENGKKVENKLNIKDESSSGGNILLKVAIAMSILSRYTNKKIDNTPFFLIIDEISKLQSKNQDLIREYINENGFKTLFITPDPAYPDPKRALYYTFKNSQEEGETLEIRQMNII